MRVHIIVVLALIAVGAAGCGDKGTPNKVTANKEGTAASFLVLDGKPVAEDGTRAGTPTISGAAAPAAAKRTKKPATTAVKALPVPPLNTDGTLVDGEDPFESRTTLAVQPTPIEDDPEITRALDLWGQTMRRIDATQWNEWMRVRPLSATDAGQDVPIRSLVKVMVERCGGAQTVATGVVLDDQTVVTTVTAVESAKRRVRIAPAGATTQRIPALIQYLDIDDDIAVLKVPGLRLQPIGTHVVTGTDPQWGRGYGIGTGGIDGVVKRIPVVVAMREQVADVEQPDGFAQMITDRSVFPVVGAIDTGFSGGIVTATNDRTLSGGWGFHGMIRARVPYRNDQAGVLVPSRLVTAALDANDQLDPWFERKTGGCPQWYR